MTQTRKSPPRNVAMTDELYSMLQQAAALEDMPAAQLARRLIRTGTTDILHKHQGGKS